MAAPYTRIPALANRSRSRFNSVAELSQEIIWECDMNGLYTYISPIAESILGYHPSEIVNKLHFYDFAPEHMREHVRDAGMVSIRNGAIMRNFENPLLAKDGRTIWMITNAAPIRDERGEIIGYRGSDQDMTVRK
jgi:PAS domain S-box-containing protein